MSGFNRPPTTTTQPNSLCVCGWVGTKERGDGREELDRKRRRKEEEGPLGMEEEEEDEEENSLSQERRGGSGPLSAPGGGR